MKKESDGYYHCQSCATKSKHLKGIIYFKGKFLCYQCKQKASKIINVPKLNIADSTLRCYTRLPREKRAKSWQIRQGNNLSENKPNPAEHSQRVFWDGLSAQEHKLIWHHLNEQGLTDEQIDEEIEKIKKQIKKSREIAKSQIKPLTFKESFEKLLEIRR
jgi:hypothetical protein